MSIRMPFGKYKGKVLENLPVGYLDWVLDWMNSEESGWMSHRRAQLWDALDKEWERRKSGPNGNLRLPPSAKRLLPEFILVGYKAMARRYHPDVGGTKDQMIALTELKKALEKLR